MNYALFLFGFICVIMNCGSESKEIACDKQVTGEQYGTVAFKCYYSITTKTNKYTRKYCCLQGIRRGSCKYTVVSDSNYTDNKFAERISMYDNKQEGVFTVTITMLKYEDVGTYICGIGIDEGEIKDTLSLSVVEELDITKEIVLIYTELRGTVIFKCNYKTNIATQRKYLCKLNKNGCINIMDSRGKTNPSYDGRVKADELNAGTFTVKMVQVRNQDAGHYACRSDDPEESTDSLTYDLRINEETDILQGSQFLTPRLGGSLSAQCNYDPKKKYKEKFWCKLQDNICNPIIKTDGYVMDAYEGRVLIHHNSTSGLIQVLMNNISKEDEGWYWCVLTDDKHDHTSAMQVKISEDNLPGLSGNKVVHVTVGDPVKLTCSYPCRFKKEEKYWCHWGNHECQLMSNVEDTQNSQLVSCQTEELMLIIESVTQKHNGFYWCGVKNGIRYGETIAVRLIVEEPIRDSDRSNTNLRANFDSGNVQVIVTPPSIDNSKSSTVTAAVVSVCAAVLVVCAVFLYLRLKKRKNSDLVSIGSYRTNISLSELDHNVGKENPVVTDLQETDISRSEDSPKIKKKGSREDLDYSCFLINKDETPNEQ